MENITYDELSVGSSGIYSKILTEEDVILFAKISGDVNPVHLDEAFAKGTLFEGRIGHGMWTGSVVSAAIATVLPGPGTIYMEQNLKFRKPVRIADEVTVTLTVTEKIAKRHVVVLDCQVTNQDSVVVAIGQAKVMAPVEKMKIEAPKLPLIVVS